MQNRNRKHHIVVLSCLLAFGCTPSQTAVKPAKKPLSEETGPASSPVSAEASSTQKQPVLPENPLARAVQGGTDESLFSISVDSADIRDVLRAFARDSLLSIVIDPDVSGSVSADLKQVSLEQLLFFLLDPLELEYTRENNVIRVSTRKLRTRIFSVNHLLIKRAASGSISVSQFSESFETGSTKITSENESDFWQEIENQLKLLVLDQDKPTNNDSASPKNANSAANSAQSQKSDKEKGNSTEKGASSAATLGSSNPQSLPAKEVVAPKIVQGPKLLIHRGSGLILVKAKPDVLEAVAKYLELVEGSVHRQVRIVARIAEVTLDDSHQLGINWEATNSSGEFKVQQNGIFANPDIAPSVSPNQGFFTAALNSNKTKIVIDALQKQGELNVLSSPSIVTLNNQPALIKVAREEVFFSTSESRQVEQGTTTITRSVSKEKITVGIVLRVTPQIGNDLYVMMDVHPIITELVGSKSVGADGQVIATAPIIDVREVNVVVRTKNEETVVIGGLMRERKVDFETGIPILSSIPLLGELFKRTESRREKSELVIFLTPIVSIGRRLEDLSDAELKNLQEHEPEVFRNLQGPVIPNLPPVKVPE